MIRLDTATRLATTTAQGTQHNMLLFDSSLGRTDMQTALYDADDNRIESISREAVDALLAEHEERFKDHISIPHYRKPILVFNHPVENIILESVGAGRRSLDFNWTTSYHLQAIKKDVERTVTPISMEALIRTADNRLIWGVRGGQVERGQAHLTPAGNLQYEVGTTVNGEGYDPLFGFFDNEALNELGLDSGAIAYERLIGVQDSPVIKGLGFLLVAETTRRFDEIYELHRDAFGVYNAAKIAGTPELDARAKIAERGFPNIDAWEHAKLIAIPDDRNALEQLIADRKVHVDGYALPMVEVGRGALIMYSAAMDKL